ncbi:MAG: YibE/F family protein [Actinomycetia bacterium]|nr:YibE/F family protein [Actinomycetes bacterium]
MLGAVDDDVRARLIVFALITLFAILVGTTVLGIATNWPRHRTVPGVSSYQHPKTIDATVTGLAAVRCQVPAAHNCSNVTIRLDSGRNKGTSATIRFGDTGSDAKVSLGDKLLVYKNPLPPGARLAGVKVPPYSFSDFQRQQPMLWLLAFFAVVVVAAGRFHGLRALVGLAASLATVIFFVVPAITDGRPPLQVAAFGALGVMLATIPLVHGGGAKSLAACLGTAFALLLTLGLADLFTSLAHLSGLTTDEAVYLQSTSHVSIKGLLLAGMVIGSLGVLGDTTVTQASTVIALRRANPTLGWKELVTHATSVGRDHIAATVNTLVLAYTGAALPVLIIFSLGGTSFGSALNGEVVAAPVIATLVGSIGLIAAVPVTTALAALLALQLPERRLRAEHVHVH